MTKDIIKILEENFPDQKFEMTKNSYGGLVHCFFIESDSEEILRNTWEKIRNMIGVYFQSVLDSEFEIWNIYLLFILPVTVDRDLKHKIEHDTISSRKIVVDNHERTKDADFRKFLFSEHISNSNLETTVSEKKKEPFDKNSLIAKHIDSLDLTKVKKNKEELLGDTLNKVEKALSK